MSVKRVAQQVADVSALYRPSGKDAGKEVKELTVLSPWTLDDGEGGCVRGQHASFSTASGHYTVAKDGLYAVTASVIPVGGGALVGGALKRRRSAQYVVVVDEPPADGCASDDDEGTRFLDMGPARFGEVMHLRAGASVAIAAMPDTRCRDSLRLRVELIQRKRRRVQPPPLSKKELKKQAKLKRRRARAEAAAQGEGEEAVAAAGAEQAGKPAGEDEESEWSDGFSSDASDDDLPHSKRGVKRLAKRLKKTHANDEES